MRRRAAILRSVELCRFPVLRSELERAQLTWTSYAMAAAARSAGSGIGSTLQHRVT